MINVTSLNGTVFFINAEKIKAVERTPDTVITLTTGERFVVKEGIKEVIMRILEYQKRVRSLAFSGNTGVSNLC